MRWKPTRAGIFNVWEYDDHVFEFGDGRLVLRGRNGSGKSNALALLFPFLLDGVMSAARMDPMGGSRSMRSLLLGRDDDDRAGRFRHDSGTGYVWMELERDQQHLTIGVGASATANRDADPWFFVTDQRVGDDLLLADGDIPLGRRQLTEQLPADAVFASAEEYRAAVDHRLLGLGARRHRLLVDLLLTLRRPHLAGKLDTEHLSATLSAGLGELDPDLIDDVAHSFDDLDAMQHELEGLAASLDAVERFLPVYRDHLVGIGRSRARAVEAAQGDLRRIDGDRRATEAQRIEADGQREEVETRIMTVTARRRQIDGEIERIQESPAFQSAAALSEVRRAADSAAAHARTTAQRAEAKRAESGEAAVAAEGARARLDRCDAEVSSAVAEWLASVVLAGVDPPFERDRFDAEQATAVVVERRAQLDHVVGLDQIAQRAVERAQRTEQELRRRHASADTARTAHEQAGAAVGQARTELAERRSTWRASVHDAMERLRPFTDPRLPLPELDDRPAPRDDETTTTASDPDLDAHRSADRHLGDLDTDAARALDAMAVSVLAQQEVVDGLDAERHAVAKEPNPGPPTNATRPDASRDGRPGAPLFVCVDFADHVDEGARAGLEAALGAAGVLDARITADGVADDALDATVISRSSAASANGSLADVLVPVPREGLSADAIRAALRSVPLDDGVVQLHSDGRWRLGPLAGRFAQPHQLYIGHAARERRRAERLAELDHRLTVERSELDRRQERHRVLEALRHELAGLRRAQPSIDALATALDDRQRRSTLLEEQLAQVESVRRDLDEHARAADATTADLHRAAAAAHLPTDANHLSEVGHVLSNCDRIRVTVIARADAQEIARHSCEGAERTAQRSRANAAADAEAAAAAAAAAIEEARRFEDLEANVGGDARRSVEQLAAAKRSRQETDDLNQRLGHERAAAEATLALLSERIRGLAERHTTATAASGAADERFAFVCSSEVSDMLGVEGVEPGAELAGAARRLRSATEPVPDDATNRMEKAHREILLDGLRAGHDPSMPKVDGIDVVRVGTADGELSIGALGRQLRAEHERTSQLLSKQEREIFETHLLTRIGDALRQLLLDADEFEHRINAEMSQAPTESGMVVELRWEVVSDEGGLRDVIQTLRTAPEMLGPERREALREFFMQRIADLRSAEPGRSFAETLTTALDYRAWHHFALFARFADGKRQRVTRAFYRGLSGGEAASLLHLPLFAAAASQYSVGSVDGPRLIALDEAFAGIDEQMRSRLMGLLTQLDLDVILTSHEFWGFYESVPSLVLYDLVRRPPDPGVFAQRFDWSADGGAGSGPPG